MVQQRAISTVRTMQVVVLLTMAADMRGALAQLADPSPGSPIRFSAVEYTAGEDPHASGQYFEFCKLNDVWLAFAGEYLGPPADPAVAAINSIEFDEAAGVIAFSFRLTAGVVLQPGSPGGVPATRQYEFSGRMDADRLAGSMTVTPQYGNADRRATATQAVSFERRRVDDQSCEQWHEMWLRRIESRITIFAEKD